jgi:hypothetical protein
MNGAPDAPVRPAGGPNGNHEVDGGRQALRSSQIFFPPELLQTLAAVLHLIFKAILCNSGSRVCVLRLRAVHESQNHKGAGIRSCINAIDSDVAVRSATA